MAKKVFKKDKVKSAIKNIAEDFRYSNDLSDSALIFYKADKDGELRGEDIGKMVEYLETGLKELEIEFKNLEWRRGFIKDNPTVDEIKIIDNLKTIKSEYLVILEAIK